MKTQKSIILILIFAFFLNCKKTNTEESLNDKKFNDTIAKIDSTVIRGIKTDTATSGVEDEMEGETETITENEFSKWYGIYEYKFPYVSSNGDEFIIFSKINFENNKNCVFESWYVNIEKADQKIDYLKIQGNIFPTDKKSKSIEFLEFKTLEGTSPSLDPVFNMRKDKNEYFIKCSLLSPPNNDNVEMSIKKIN